MARSPMLLVILTGVICIIAAFNYADAQTCNAGGIRVDCCPNGCNQQGCQQKNCCWSPVSQGNVRHTDAEADPHMSAPQGVAWCFNPNPSTVGYRITSITATTYGYEATLNIDKGPNVFGTDISPLHMTVSMETETRLHVKIFDPNNRRWEVPNVVKTTTPKTKPAKQDYIFSYTSAPFGFAVQRASTLETLFNSTPPANGGSFNGMIFEDQYLELSTQLPRQPNIYGLGERVHPLRLDAGGAYYTMWTTDDATPVNINLYASQPFYIEMRNSTPSAAAHGVFLLNSNGMDVYLGPNQLTYRVIGGVLDFYFFTGPSPNSVVQQYTQVVGRPYMPAYWTLGWHQCRYGYHTIQDVETVVSQYAANNIPLDTIWTDIDYMDKYYDFTWDPVRYPVAQVKAFTDKLHANGQHYVPIVDCGIPNDTSYEAWSYGLQQDIFIKDAQGKPFIGKVWPGLTGWVDWWNPKANNYWYTLFKTFLSTVPYDGIWIDMNEISNFCDGACTSEESKKAIMPPQKPGFNPVNPPYTINNRGNKEALNTKTTDMTCQHYNGISEYNVHNMFGYMEANATQLALEKVYGKRAFVLSRSTFPGHGYHAAHWLGDNASTWPDLYYAIPGILNFQFFGIPQVGADICGFMQDTTEELCARWMQVGVFYPFSRNHNGGNQAQEPYVWPTVAAVSRTVLAIKYSLLPYYYTLFWQAHINGSTVARPLFFEFPDDINCMWIDRQFLIGSGFLITPVLDQGATSVQGYFPQARWYDYYSQKQFTTGPGYITVSAPLEFLPLHLRGGTIIPTQGPAMTTAAARQNPFGLLVPLNESNQAEGELYLDDGESLQTEVSGKFTYIKYTTANNQLRAAIVNNGYPTAASLYLTSVNILGAVSCPRTVTLNGGSVSFTCDPSVLAIAVSNIKQPMNSAFTLAWN